MDNAKCNALKDHLAALPEPQLIPVSQFFDGNDDLGLIGCNLDTHPGMATFQTILTGLLRRPDVQAVYAQISESDPGEGCWPFSDTIIVAGEISPNDLRSAVAQLQPDEVGDSKAFGISASIAERLGSQLLVIWWD